MCVCNTHFLRFHVTIFQSERSEGFACPGLILELFRLLCPYISICASVFFQYYKPSAEFTGCIGWVQRVHCCSIGSCTLYALFCSFPSHFFSCRLCDAWVREKNIANKMKAFFVRQCCKEKNVISKFC